MVRREHSSGTVFVESPQSGPTNSDAEVPLCECEEVSAPGGKGSIQRPTNDKSYSEGYERIFGKGKDASSENINFYDGIEVKTDSPDKQGFMIELENGKYAVTSN